MYSILRKSFKIFIYYSIKPWRQKRKFIRPRRKRCENEKLVNFSIFVLFMFITIVAFCLFLSGRLDILYIKKLPPLFLIPFNKIYTNIHKSLILDSVTEYPNEPSFKFILFIIIIQFLYPHSNFLLIIMIPIKYSNFLTYILMSWWILTLNAYFSVQITTIKFMDINVV